MGRLLALVEIFGSGVFVVKVQSKLGKIKAVLPAALCVTAALAVLSLAAIDPAFAQGGYDGQKFGDICEKTFGYLEGGFGALLAAVAGIGAIVASAAGGFRVAWALVVVSVGAFILREYITIFFTGGCSGA